MDIYFRRQAFNGEREREKGNKLGRMTVQAKGYPAYPHIVMVT